MTELPARPPEAELLRRTRTRMRLSIREAAARASRIMPAGSGGRDGISEGRLRQIEAGYQTVSKGIQVPTSASGDTLAYLAKFYGISAEELESEGQRPDAARALTEILRRENAAPAPASPVPASDLADRALRLTIEMIRDDRPELKKALISILNLQDGNGDPLPSRLEIYIAIAERSLGLTRAVTEIQRRNGTDS